MDSVTESIETIGGNTFGVIADVSRAADLDCAFHEIREKVGRIDVLLPMLESADSFLCGSQLKRASTQLPIPTSRVRSSQSIVHYQ